MRGRTLTAKKAILITAVAFSTAWALWWLNYLMFDYYLWSYQGTYVRTVAVVNTTTYRKHAKGASYTADVTIEGELKQIKLPGFNEFDRELLKHDNSNPYKGLTLQVLTSEIATQRPQLTNRSVHIIPGDTNLSNPGCRLLLQASIAFVPLLLSLVACTRNKSAR